MREYTLGSGTKPRAPSWYPMFTIAAPVLAALAVLMHILVGHPVHQTDAGSSMAHGQIGTPDPGVNRAPLMVAMSFDTGSLIPHEVASGRDDAGCSESRWVAQRLDPLLDFVPLASTSIDIVPRVSAVAETLFCRLALPIPDGPGRQALLQRFTL